MRRADHSTVCQVVLRIDHKMDYAKLLSSNLPAEVQTHPGLKADTKYVFSVTNADPDTLPAHGLAEALRDAMRREGRELAPYPPNQGHEGMRALVSEKVGEKRRVVAEVDSMFLSSGAGGAIKCFLEALIDPGDVVLTEEFTYLGTLNMLLERRASVIQVPTDSEGMDTNVLEKTIGELASKAKRPKLIYTIPVYQNPMGMTLSLDRRKHMLDISHRYGVPILENESYADFRIDGPPLPPSIMSMDDRESVIYVSSYTKLLGCGLRLGFGISPEPLRPTLDRLRFGGSPSHLAAMTVHEYLRNHMEEHVEEVRISLRAKRDAMLAALGEHFPPTCEWNRPEGGMMVWGPSSRGGRYLGGPGPGRGGGLEI